MHACSSVPCKRAPLLPQQASEAEEGSEGEEEEAAGPSAGKRRRGGSSEAEEDDEWGWSEDAEALQILSRTQDGKQVGGEGGRGGGREGGGREGCLIRCQGSEPLYEPL